MASHMELKPNTVNLWLEYNGLDYLKQDIASLDFEIPEDFLEMTNNDIDGVADRFKWELKTKTKFKRCFRTARMDMERISDQSGGYGLSDSRVVVDVACLEYGELDLDSPRFKKVVKAIEKNKKFVMRPIADPTRFVIQSTCEITKKDVEKIARILGKSEYTCHINGGTRGDKQGGIVCRPMDPFTSDDYLAEENEYEDEGLGSLLFKDLKKINGMETAFSFHEIDSIYSSPFYPETTPFIVNAWDWSDSMGMVQPGDGYMFDTKTKAPEELGGLEAFGEEEKADPAKSNSMPVEEVCEACGRKFEATN